MTATKFTEIVRMNLNFWWVAEHEAVETSEPASAFGRSIKSVEVDGCKVTHRRLRGRDMFTTSSDSGRTLVLQS